MYSITLKTGGIYYVFLYLMELLISALLCLIIESFFIIFGCIGSKLLYRLSWIQQAVATLVALCGLLFLESTDSGAHRLQ